MSASSAMRKSPLQVVQGFGRAPGLVVVEEGLHDDLAEAVARVERDVRDPERVAGRARAPHGVGRAAGARGVRCVGIDPEAQRDADGGIAAIDDALQRDGRVDAARHGDGGPGAGAAADASACDAPSAIAAASASSATAAHSWRSAGISRSADAAREAQRRPRRATTRPRRARRTRQRPRSPRCSRAPRSVPAAIRPVGVEAELDPHAIAARRAAGCTVAIGSLEHGPRARDLRAASLMRARRRSRRAASARAWRRQRRGARPSAGSVALAERCCAERRAQPSAPLPWPRARCSARARRCGRPLLRRDREALVVEQRAERVAAHAGDQREAVARQPRDLAEAMRTSGRRAQSAARTRRGSPRSRRRARCRATRRASAAATPAACATLSVPGRRPRSWPPPCSTGRERRDASASEHAGALRAVQLVRRRSPP